MGGVGGSGGLTKEAFDDGGGGHSEDVAADEGHVKRGSETGVTLRIQECESMPLDAIYASGCNCGSFRKFNFRNEKVSTSPELRDLSPSRLQPGCSVTCHVTQRIGP